MSSFPYSSFLDEGEVLQNPFGFVHVGSFFSPSHALLETEFEDLRFASSPQISGYDPQIPAPIMAAGGDAPFRRAPIGVIDLRVDRHQMSSRLARRPIIIDPPLSSPIPPPIADTSLQPYTVSSALAARRAARKASAASAPTISSSSSAGAAALPSICAVCLDDLKSSAEDGGGDDDVMIDWLRDGQLSACRHVFHSNCLRNLIEHDMKEQKFPTRCPLPSCRTPIWHSDLRRLLPSQLFKKYVQAEFLHFIDSNPKEFSHCPSVNCSYIFSCDAAEPPRPLPMEPLPSPRQAVAPFFAAANAGSISRANRGPASSPPLALAPLLDLISSSLPISVLALSANPLAQLSLARAQAAAAGSPFLLLPPPLSSSVPSSSSSSSSSFKAQGPGSFACPLCLKAYCLACRGPSHGVAPCESKEDAQRTERQFLENGFRRCGRCQVWVERTSGCNRVQCRCGYQFCFQCGAEPAKCSCHSAFPLSLPLFGTAAMMPPFFSSLVGSRRQTSSTLGSRKRRRRR